MDETQPQTIEFKADTRQLRDELDKTTQLGTQFAATLTKAFSGLSVEGKSFGDVLRSLGQRLSELALTAALKPLENLIGNFAGQLLGGGLPFAKGAR